MIEKIRALISQDEGIEVEFKRSNQELSESGFDTICAFLNRDGGHLLFGIEDNGRVLGIKHHLAEEMRNQIIKSCNNPEKINPPFYLSPELVDYEGLTILYIFVPQSS